MNIGDRVWAIEYDGDGYVVDHPEQYIVIAMNDSYVIGFPVGNSRYDWDLKEVWSYCRTATWVDGEAPLCVFHESNVFPTKNQAEVAIDERANERRGIC